MADALVSFMLEKLATVIQDGIRQEVSLVVGAEEEVEKLKTTFKFIQAVLNDAELKQIKNELVKVWLEEFKDIAYDMDDVLDEWSYQMHKSQNDTCALFGLTMVSPYLCSLCSCFGKFVFRHNIGTQIIKINERLDQAEKEKKRFGLVKITRDDNPIERLKSSSIVDVADILGRDTDKDTIMSKLIVLGESSTCTTQPETSSTQALHAPNIISIVGMGGLGKTTLAQLVFNDDRVKTHFEKTMWVCVSDPFDLVTVTKAIIEEAKCEVPNSSEWNTLHGSLTESLKGKKFLLVLDDVWTEDRSKWDPLEVSFRHGAKGSRILVTTRNEGVTSMMNTIYTHSLGVLSDDDCSSLLNRIALAGDNMKTHEDLREIGEKISKKCKGLPLAAKALGGLLHSKKNKNYWSNILESEIWKLEEVENSFLKPVLLLSYYNLPLPLKGCFVYCSIFPKDHVLKRDLLVKLWMAQGFLNKSGSEDLEVTGEDYFNNLAKRSFFQDFTKDDDGDIISCKMHDLVHDLAQYLTKNECFVKETHKSYDEKELNRSRVRHLTITGFYDDGFTSSVCNAEKLRTLQILNVWRLRIKEAPADLFHRFRCLKVLCLNDISHEILSGEIGNLIHLRYLDLSNNFNLKILPETISNLYNLQTLKLKDCRSLCQLPREMRRMINLRHLDLSDNSNLTILPETISNLYNMQTLKLKGCVSLCKLPKEMWRMINLRHLDLGDTDQLSYIPQGIGGLTCLRTLNKFIVGGASEGCKISELKNLNLLQGDLNIQGLGRVETVNEAALEMVLKQKTLHSLTLGFKPNNEDGIAGNLENLQRMEGVLDVLEPHPDVMELTVSDYLGLKLSRWMESTSIHVKTLKLYNCINLTKFPAFGQLPSLEVLDIRRAIKVKHIGCEFLYEVDEEEAAAGGEVLRFNNNNNTAAFPKLESLSIMWVSKEMEWEFEEGVIAFPILPCLRKLVIGGFRNSKSFVEILSKISSLESLSIRVEATEFIKYIRRHDDDDDDLYIRHDDEIILFPNLKELLLGDLEDMEELKIGFQVMPLLKELAISKCNKLKAIQVVGGSLSKLESLSFYGGCPSLYELPPFPNLKILDIFGGPIHPSLSERLRLNRCGDELQQRCRKDEGEGWRIISHIPNIRINWNWDMIIEGPIHPSLPEATLEDSIIWGYYTPSTLA